MRVRLNRDVFSDLSSAMEFYAENAGVQTAKGFFDEFRRCRQIVSVRGHAFPEIRKGVRRINLNRFPYHILYQMRADGTAEILVVKHDRRDPDFGLDR